MGVSLGHLDTFVSQEQFHFVQINSAHNQPTGEGMPQIVPVKVFNLGFLEIVNPIGMFDAVLHRLTRLLAWKHVGIMKHSRQALQGFTTRLFIPMWRLCLTWTF